MSIISPEQRDFNQVLLDIGQTSTIRIVTRTVDADGRVTNVTSSDSSISAVVDEVDDKRSDLLESGYFNIGDTLFYVDPNTVVKIFDKIIWNGIVYGVKTINYPEKIAGHYCYMRIHAVRDNAE